MRQNLILNAFQGLRISTPATTTTSSSLAATASSTRLQVPLRRPALLSSSSPLSLSTTLARPPCQPLLSRRPFSSTAARPGTWLEPKLNRKKKMFKGRPRVATGGSAKGTTVVWGEYGLRMRDHHRRISAAQLKLAEDTIKQRLRGQRYRLYKRVNCNIGVFVSGNEMRMGKGKGSFDHWASRVAVNRIIFELRGAIHEQIARDAFRLAGNKLPGQYEFVKKGDPPVVGTTKMEDGLTLDDLRRPRRELPPAPPPVAESEVAAAAGGAAPPS